ncbi:MAG TPA: hypothetical protein VF045_04450, partial [Acidimicrobiales bacterium]
MRRRVGRILLAAATGVTGVMFSSGTAHAAVTCGSTVNASTTLTSDLNCSGTAVFIGASNVILDLGGHTVSGVQAPDDQFGNSGVHIVSNRTGVIVRNGTIRGFNRGVTVNPGANNALITGLTVDSAALGIGVFGDPSTAPRNTRIVRNTISNTTRFSGMQIAGNGHRIEANTVRNGAGAG